LHGTEAENDNCNARCVVLFGPGPRTRDRPCLPAWPVRGQAAGALTSPIDKTNASLSRGPCCGIGRHIARACGN
jgi:hypothetical protein